MSTDRETTRVVRSWLEEGVTVLPDRVLDTVLDQVPTTPQRRSGWSAWRSYRMNTYAKLAAAAAAVVLVAVVGYQFLPRNGGIGGQPTVTPSPSPSLLAKGSFTAHGVAAQIDATGSDATVNGTMTVADSGNTATVRLECSRSLTDGLLLIGGVVTASTYTDNFPKDRRVALILQRGDPVKGLWWFAFTAEAPVTSCPALLDMMKAADVLPGLEPIGGTIQLGS
jgi:hypothetical protein